MALDLIVTLVAGFLAVALLAGYGASSILAALSPERRRLRQLTTIGPAGDSLDSTFTLVDNIDPRFKNLPGIPKSPKEMGRLRRRLAMAGYTSPTAVVVFALANLAVAGAARARHVDRHGSARRMALRFARGRAGIPRAGNAARAERSSCESGRFVKGFRTRSICSSSASRPAAGWTRRS